MDITCVKPGLTPAQKCDLALKQATDILLSGLGILVLLPVLLILALVIQCDSKGPVFPRKKRGGKDGTFFQIFKFRTMRTDTSRDMPTHLRNDPEAFLTRSGRFLRKTSLDALPIDIKAGFNGECILKMSFLFDRKCVFGTITSLLCHEGVVEGGTGAMEKEKRK